LHHRQLDRRRHERWIIPDHVIELQGEGKTFTFSTKDISLDGTGFESLGRRFQPGEVLVVDVLKEGAPLIERLRLRVVWSGVECVGCQLLDPDPRQQDAIRQMLC